MSDPTDADRAKAAEVAEASRYRGEEVLKKCIAAALAEERHQARAPFLDLLRLIEEGYFAPESYNKGIQWVAGRLRVIATETAP